MSGIFDIDIERRFIEKHVVCLQCLNEYGLQVDRTQAA